MKRHPRLDVLLISSILILTAIIGLFIFVSGNSKFQSAKALAKDSTEKTEENIKKIIPAIEIPSDFEGIQLFKEISSDPSFPYSITYPTTQYEILNEEITQYIETSKRQHLSAVEFKKTSNMPIKNGFKISVEISKYNQKYYSITFIKQETFNGNDYGETFNTIFFNQETGKKIYPQTLFNNNIQNLEKLSTYVRQKMLEQKNYKENIIIAKWNNASYPYWERYNRFAIVNDSLVLYYNKGEFSNEIIGSPSISIPLTFINPILAPEFQFETKSEITILTPTKDKPSKRVALTFDDGPHPTVTTQILNTLDKYNAKATFFMVGNRVEKNSSIVKDVLARGHEIGNHTWNHPELTELDSTDVLSQISSTNHAIYNTTGQYPTVFRPPYGAKNKQVTDQIKVPVVMWTIDTLDWKYRDSSKLLPIIQKNLKNDDIILMHDIHQSTADGLESILGYLQKQGYECVTVSEILSYQK